MKRVDNQDRPLIILTGGAGFIGSCLVRYLNDLGFQNLLLVDHLGRTEKWKNLVGKRFIDLLAKEELFSWLQGREALIEAFIHLGACTDTMETDADYLFENNTRYSIRLAEYALQHSLRFIYASSAATYGEGHQGFPDDPRQLYSLKPLNMYGFSKQLFDQWAFNEGVLSQLVGLKFFNVFGPNESHKGRMASAITRMVPQILKEKKVYLFKSTDLAHYQNGEQKRDFIYVKDLVRMIHAFLMKKTAGGLYNIGSGRASTWNELAGAVFEALDYPKQIEYIDMPPDLVAKYQNYSCADMTKTKEILQQEAQCYPLQEAVFDYVHNYLLPGKLW